MCLAEHDLPGPLFQSLSGFQVRCNIADRVLMAAMRRVSIPIGFSSSLQQVPPHVIGKRPVLFQSLSGFQVRCNSGSWFARNSSPEFQSLSGFQVRCNAL